MKWWPLCWRWTLEAVQAELDAERKRARRRAKRAEKQRPLSPPTHNELVEAVIDADGSSANEPDLPPAVLEAIESRAGSLHSGTAVKMATAARKALSAGEKPDAVAAWMWAGDPS